MRKNTSFKSRMKSGREWLELLPEHIREQIQQNCIAQGTTHMLDEKFVSAQSLLFGAFSWKSTDPKTQGLDYWHGVFNSLDRDELRI
jgi:hypothetical protein